MGGWKRVSIGIELPVDYADGQLNCVEKVSAIYPPELYVWKCSQSEWSVMAHYSDVTMSGMASQITGVSIVCSTVCFGVDQRKYQSSASLAFVRGIHRWSMDSTHKGQVKRKMFPFDNVIMWCNIFVLDLHTFLKHILIYNVTRLSFPVYFFHFFETCSTEIRSSINSSWCRVRLLSMITLHDPVRRAVQNVYYLQFHGGPATNKDGLVHDSFCAPVMFKRSPPRYKLSSDIRTLISTMVAVTHQCLANRFRKTYTITVVNDHQLHFIPQPPFFLSFLGQYYTISCHLTMTNETRHCI